MRSLLKCWLAAIRSAPSLAGAADEANVGLLFRRIAPFGSAGTNRKLDGDDIEAAHQLAKPLGVGVAMTPVPWANRFPCLPTKKVDLIVYSRGKNAERKKVMDFSHPGNLSFSIPHRRTPGALLFLSTSA